MGIKLKRFLSMALAVLMVFSMVPATAFATDSEADLTTIEDITDDGKVVAKIGNTEYPTIDEAIANWTAGTTLTLLDNVTLSDVITLKSTEHHILDLGTYTMTAAQGKNAIEIVAYGTGDAERSAITINADATNPGGINAGSKSIVYYDYSKGQATGNDRPIIKINGGVFTGSTSSVLSGGIYFKGTAARKCATLNISGGTFNCSILGTGKSKLIISGGTFNYSVGSQGDSTCSRLISGGTFKSFGFMTADSNNTKFWIGTAMGTSNVGTYIDDDGYLVVGGSVITEAGETFEASSDNYGGFSSYLQYSSAATNGLYYTDVEEALADNNSTSGKVTVYTDELDLTEIAYKGTIVIPEGNDITITYTSTNDYKPKVIDSEGNTVELHVMPDENGVITGTNFESAAQIGSKKYKSLQEAVDAAEDGDKILILKDIENPEITVKENVTIDLNDKTLIDAYIIVTADVTIENGSIKNTEEAYPLVVQNGGELTIEDVAIEASKSDRAIWVRENSTLNFNSGSILATKGEGNTKTSNIAAIYTAANTQVNINGGTITVDTPNNKANGIYGNYNNADVTMTDGKISTSGANYSYGIHVDGDITISGGEIVTNEKGYCYSSGITYGYNYALNTALGNVTITGGKITTNGHSGYLANVGRTYSSNDQTIEISNVTFTNNLSEIDKTTGGHDVPPLIKENSASTVTATITSGTFEGISATAIKGDSATLTISGGTFDVAVDEVFLADGFKMQSNGDGTYGVAEIVVAKIGEKNYATLQAAINAVQNGETIVLTEEITENVTITQKAGISFTIDGDNNTYTGSITVDGKSARYDTAALTIKNVEFDATSITTDACINLGVSGNTNTRYTNHVTVEDCTFTGGNRIKVAVKSYTGGDMNLTITGCSVDNTMHSLLQVDNVTGLMIDGCTVKSKNGINLNSSSAVEIKDSEISVSGYAVRIGVSGGTSGEVTLTGNTLKTDNSEGDAVVVVRGTASQQVDLTMTGNVVSGTTHISGTTAATKVSADANYWDGKVAPVVDGTAVEVKSYYADAELTNLIIPPDGTITPAFTRNDGFWGEGTSNSTESFVVELYEGDNKIAYASLNDINNIIDGTTKNVTWSIPFAGSTDEYWDVEWATGYPKYDMNPDKVVLVVDGTQVATNNVQFNAPDNLNKIVALAEGFTGGVKAYTSLADAMGNFNGRKVNVLRDVTESIEGFYGATLTTNVEGGVTITNTNTEDWIDFDDVVVGKGVTVNIPNVYSGDSENTILGTLNVGETYYHGYDAKTTIKDGGKVTVGDSTILRYNESADAGIYIYGDGDDSTVEFDCDYYIGAYSGTFYAENANVETGYFLLKNSYDADSDKGDFAGVELKLDNSSLKTVGTSDGQGQFIADYDATITLTNGSTVAIKTTYTADATVELNVDETSKINSTSFNLPVTHLFGEGTAASPYQINNTYELEWFRDDVNAGNNYFNKYVKLTTDIDLENNEWTPIGNNRTTAFEGIFDGGDHTIKNLSITTGSDYAGFFGNIKDADDAYSTGIVRNLTIENASITGSLYVGAIVGYGYTGLVENCTVKGNITIDGWWYIGGISGYGYADVINCHVIGEDGSYIKGNDGSYVGGICGFRGEGGSDIINCSVTNVAISGVDRVGGISGMGHFGNTISGCKAEDVTIEATDPDATTIGLIVGATQGTESSPTVFENNTLTETTAKVGDKEITDLYGTNTNGTEPVTNYVAEIDGVLYLSLQDAIDAVQEDETITLLRNVTITEGANGSSNGISYTRGASFTLDLNGKAITSDLGNNALRFKIGDGTEVTNPVTITIKNGKVVSGANNWCAISAASTGADHKLTMYLEDLEVEANKGGDFAIKSWEYAVVNAKNVTVTGNYAGGFYAVGGEIVLDDCTVTQTGLHTAPYNSMAFGVSDGGMMTINSGNYSAEPKTAADGNNQGSSHGSWVGGIMNSGGTLIINGGTFSNGNYGDDSLATAARGLLFVDTGATLEINGGEFNALKGIIDYQNNLGDASKNPVVDIYGGTFSAPIDEKYCGDGYVPTEISEGVYGVKAANEAMIFRNGRPKYYSTLAAAIADAKEDETVVLQASVIVGEKIAINKNLTISDYGSLTISFIGNGGFSITNDAEVVIDQCNIDVSGAVAKGDCIIGIGDYSNNAKLTLNDVNIVGDNYSSAYAVFYVYNTSELNIVDSNINLSNDKASAGGFIKAEQGADGIVNITDSVINLTDAQRGFVDCTVTMEGVELTIEGGGNGINQSALTVIDSTLTIKNCDGRALTLYQGDVTIENSTLDFSGCSEGEILFNKALNLNVDEDSTITECTIYADASSGATVNGETVTGTEIYKSTISAADGTTTLVNPDWAAKIGETYYMTLAEAVAAGGTVVLQKDIELAETIAVATGNTVVLDLNGKTIAGTDNKTSGNFYLFDNRGTLTIKDSGTDGKITLTATNDRDISASSVVVANNPGGDLTVESGTIEHLGGTYMAYALDNLTNVPGDDVYMTINGGTIKSTYRAIRQFLNSTTNENVLIINGGTIEGTNKAIFFQDPNTSANNGTITIRADADVNGGVYLYVTAGSTAWPVEVSISAAAVDSVTSGNVPAGYELISIDGTYCVKNGIAKIGTDYYPSLKDALDAAQGETNIVIDLINDATLDITAWQTLAIGGATTETITINGNDYTLSFNKKNSDWNHIATNNDAKLILNDMTITDSGYNDGPWNRYDINFGCDVELNNVTSSKALAFKADATLNGVTINESGDNYAIWIQANGQNVEIDGLTINSAGRGIKIDEQYVAAEDVALVNLSVENATFTTAKKAAILVKSVAGAKIIAENVNIAGVEDDSTNIVWVDEDSANVFGNVTINGENAVMESADKFYASAISNGVFGYYKTLASALAAADDGSTVTLIADVSTGKMNISKDVIIDLADNKLTLTEGGNYMLGDVTIKNGTIDVSGVTATGDCIIGIGNRSTDATLKLEDVNLNGSNYSSAFAVLMVYGDSTLNIENGEWNLSNDLYSGGGVIKNENGAGEEGSVNITGTKMTFDNVVRGITGATVVLDGVEMTITGGDNGINGSKLTVKDSTLNISGGTGRALTVTDYDVVIENSALNFSGNGEADILIKTANELTVDETSTLNECVVYAKVSSGATVNGETITGTETYKSKVTVANGITTVINPDWDAKIGATYYMTLAEAIAAAQKDDTIVLLDDAEISSKLTIGSNSAFDKINITLEGNGHAIKASEDYVKANERESMVDVTWNVTMNNVTFDANGVGTRGVQFYTSNSVLNNVTIKNVQHDSWGKDYALQLNASTVKVTGELNMVNCSKSYIIMDYGSSIPAGTNCKLDISAATLTGVNAIVDDTAGRAEANGADVIIELNDSYWLYNGVAYASVTDATVGAAIINDVDNVIYATLALALAEAKAGDVITVINDIEITESLTVPSSVTVTSEEGVVITTDVHHAFVLSDGAVLNGLTIDQPTVTGAVNTIYMNSNSQVINSTVTGQYGINENDTTCRAIEVAPGATGVTISGNTFKNLRQPAYVNNACTGTIANNNVEGTKGWVICSDSNMTITRNTFGENAVDICIIASGNSDNYAGKTVELSEINNGAYVENQVQSVLADDGVLVAKDTKTLQGAIKEAKSGDTITIIADGTYTLPSFSKELTIKAAEDVDAQINMSNPVTLAGAKVTFENLTFDYYPNKDYTGLQHVDTVTYNNCTINGQVFLYGNVETFNNCTFNQNSADAYNVWTYGADKVLFNDCTFNSAGKSVLIYSEDASLYSDVKFVDCELNASALVEGKAAIEMDSSLTAGIKLTIDDATTATGFDNGNVSGNSLWNNKKGTEGVNNDITVIVDEEIVLQPIKTAQIGNLYYTTLEAAIEAATNGQTIILLTYIEVDATVVLNKAITLDLNENTISSSDNINVIEITDNATIKNGTVSGYRTGTTNGVVKVNSGALTLDTVKLVNTGTSYNLRALRVQSGSSATLINCDVTGFISGVGTTEIKSGTYANCEGSDYNVLDGAGIAVSGGTFGYVIEVTDCAEGYKPYDNGDGTWTVTDSTFATDLTIRDIYDLQLFRNMVDAGDNFSGKTVTLAAKIDLGNVAWDPIGEDENAPFSGTFDGAGYTISNLNIGNGNNMGFFGAVQNATIKNLTVDNASVITQGTGVGVIVGRSFGNSNFENLNVTGLVKVEGLNYVGGIVGYAYGYYTNCSVNVDDGSYVQSNLPGSYAYVGGIAGWNGEGACKFADCSVNNITLNALSSDGAHSYGIGGLVGIAQDGNVIEDCSVTNVTINAGEATYTGTIIGLNNGTETAPVMILNNSVDNVIVYVDGVKTEVDVIGTHNRGAQPTALTIIGTDVEKDDAGKFIAGTFNVEVDSYCAEGYDSIADGDVYIVVEEGTVAKFNDVCYSDLTDALDAAEAAGGGTVTMYDDYTEMFVMIDDSVTLDLNGHGLTITGRMLAAFGDVIDSTDGEGGLYVGINDAVVLQADNGGYMPIYDSANGCYRFYTYTLQNLTPQYSGTDVVTYGYRLRFSNVDAYNLLINAIDDSNFEMMVKLSWSTEGNMNAPLTYTIPNEYISTFASTAARQLTNNGNVTAAITFKVTGLSSLAPDTTVSTSVTAQSGTGVKTESDNKNVVTAANTVTE